MEKADEHMYFLIALCVSVCIDRISVDAKLIQVTCLGDKFAN